MKATWQRRSPVRSRIDPTYLTYSRRSGRRPLGLNGPLIRFCFLAAFAYIPAIRAAEQTTFGAFSFRVAQQQVEEAERHGTDWRKKQPDLFYLGRITKPLAVVLDRQTKEWILVGERNPALPAVTLDDWAVALRSRFMYSNRDSSDRPESNPGVTIDPYCGTGKRPQDCTDYTKQVVRFFAGVQNSHFGQVCYQSDWLMKRIGLGLEHISLDGFRSYYDLLLADAPERTKSLRLHTRFWFYPVMDQVDLLGDVILLSPRFQVGVFTQVMRAELDGKTVTGVADRSAETFARALSANYDKLAISQPVLEELREITRLAALAKGLTQADNRPDVEYFLTKYRPVSIETPQEAEVLRRSDGETGFGISGGVELMALAMRMKNGDATALKELVFASRQSSRSAGLFWAFSMETEGGRPTRVSIPNTVDQVNGVVPLLAHADFLSQNDRYDDALVAYREAIRLNPNLPQAYLNRGITYFGKHEYDLALEDLNKALSLDLGFPQAYHARASLLNARKEFDRALDDIDSALRINPDDSEAFQIRGDVWHSKGAFASAIADYTRAIALDPYNAQAYANRAAIYAKVGDTDRAIAEFSSALRINPFYRFALSERASVFIKKRDLDRALEDYSTALALDANDAAAYMNRGGIYSEKNQWEKASADFNRSLAIDNKNAEAWSDRGLVKYRSGDLSGALDDLNQAIALDAELPEAYNNRGLVYLGKRLQDLAIADFENAISLYDAAPTKSKRQDAGHYAEALTNLGATWFDRGYYNRSVIEFDKAISVDSGYALAFYNRGMAYAKQEEFLSAVADFRQAASIDPTHLKSYYYEAWSYEHADRLEEAIQAYQTFLRLASSSEFASLVNDAKSRVARITEKLKAKLN